MPQPVARTLRLSRPAVSALVGLGIAATAAAAPADAQEPGGGLDAAVASSSAAGVQAYQDAVTQLPTNPFLLPVPVAHPGAPAPQAFGAERIAGWYDSDISPSGPFYFHAVTAFPDLVANHPEVMSASLERTVEINNAAAAEPGRVERALADDHDDLLVTMADAWGEEAAGHFRAALAEGRLPKTTQLLGGDLGRGGWLSSTTGPEKYYFNYPRPFVVDNDRIQRHHRDGADDEYSTSPSFPSGHTNQATWKSTLLAAMVPEAGLPVIARGSEVGYNRVALGVHYPLDVIGGRMTGTAAAADRLADPEFLALVSEAGEEIRAEMAWRCGRELAECVAPRAAGDDVADYTARMDYGLPHPGAAGAGMVVPAGADAALVTRFPQLTPAQRAQVLALTAADSGAPLDAAGPAGSWQRINLAAAWAADPVVGADGTVSLR